MPQVTPQVASRCGVFEIIMATRATVDQVAKNVGVPFDPGGPLDKLISLEHIVDVSGVMTRWKIVASRLGVEEAALEGIDDKYSDMQEKKEEMLKAWRNKDWSNATYRRLGEVFYKMSRTDLTERVFKLAGEFSSIDIIILVWLMHL